MLSTLLYTDLFILQKCYYLHSDFDRIQFINKQYLTFVFENSNVKKVIKIIKPSVCHGIATIK